MLLGSGAVRSQNDSHPQEQGGAPQPAEQEGQKSSNDDTSGGAASKLNEPIVPTDALSAPSNTSQPVAHQQTAKSDNESSGKNWSKIFLDHLPDWFVAFFTAVLSIFTYKLWMATAGLWDATQGLLKFAGEQARDMKESIAAAKQSPRGFNWTCILPSEPAQPLHFTAEIELAALPQDREDEFELYMAFFTAYRFVHSETVAEVSTVYQLHAKQLGMSGSGEPTLQDIRLKMALFDGGKTVAVIRMEMPGRSLT